MPRLALAIAAVLALAPALVLSPGSGMRAQISAAPPPATQTTPTPPQGRAVLTVKGQGVQIYRCDAPSGAWILDHPDADLLDPAGKWVGHHAAGPVWRYKDGSSVHGEAIEKTPSPDPGSIPWLVLRATTHEGAGLLTNVETIRRTATRGGAAPSTGCDASHGGAMVHVSYTATYTFYGKP